EVDRALGDPGPSSHVLESKGSPPVLRREPGRLSKDHVGALPAHAISKAFVHCSEWHTTRSGPLDTPGARNEPKSTRALRQLRSRRGPGSGLADVARVRRS